MQVQVSQRGAVAVVRADGAVTRAEADELKACAADALSRQFGRMVLDMAAVPYVDSRGLEVLVELNEALAASGSVLKLCRVNATVREILDLTGLSSDFEQYDEVNAGVRSFL
ncbi:MAG: STAS domain-containing protein [Rhodospirillales bacterium]|nr:STAS domain-containing protein [Rhodospirillales bacterium]